MVRQNSIHVIAVDNRGRARHDQSVLEMIVVTVRALALACRVRLIRFRGHLLKGGYDVHTDGRHSEEEPAPAPAV